MRLLNTTTNSLYMENKTNDDNDTITTTATAPTNGPVFKFIPGPILNFNVGQIANLCESSVIGSSGLTVALAIMATTTTTSSIETDARDSGVVVNRQNLLGKYLKQKCQKESNSMIVPLTVDYRQRHHAVGKIPTSANRADNRRPTNAETLASRAIDRALRPLLKRADDAAINTQSIHLTCSIQACAITEDGSIGGHPVALALNSASVAMRERLIEPVAAIFLCLTADGSILEDPSVSFSGQDVNNQNPIVCELLYAGTKDFVVMMEFSGELEESKLIDLIYKAHERIQPRLEIQNNVSQEPSSKEQDLDDDALRKELGLESVESVVNDDSVVVSKAEIIYEQAYGHCREKLWDVALRLFGVALNDTNSGDCLESKSTTTVIHSEGKDGPLLGKGHRGRRESLFREEIKRRLVEFVPSDNGLSNEFSDLVAEESSIVAILAEAIHSKMLKEAMKEAVGKYDCRSDGRSNTKVIRPLSMEVPALPDVVHGSALFTRGETQVLCTTTLGPPKDGILLNDPYLLTSSKEKDKAKVDSPYSDLPVGSLRYLKNQEYLESDLNSRKVKASREQTGDSGTLSERRRAFLQYDFPSYSKGEVQSGPASSASRREIGHGMLAEKAITPILPPVSEFPYALRMTSEVTSSNGSSSMASVCGVTLALLDAGRLQKS